MLQGGDGVSELQSALSERDAEILRLKEEVKVLTAEREDTVTHVSLNGLLHTKQKSLWTVCRCILSRDVFSLTSFSFSV